MKFFFKAKDQAGKEQEGVVNALSEELAVQILQRNNLIPVSITREGQEKISSLSDLTRSLQKAWEGVSPKEMVIFYRQLSTLISAHVPILTAIHAVADQMENKFFRGVLLDIANNVEDGMSLSESMASHPDVFPSIAVSMIRAGEALGNLQRSINTLADSIEKNYELTSKIRGALIYPGFIMGVGGVVGFLIVTVILPKLTEIIKGMNVVVPWYTQVVMAVGDFMSAYWWAVLLGIFSVIGAIAYYLNTDNGRREWQRIVLTLPVFGPLMKYVYLARFADGMEAILSSGIPMVRSLLIVADIVDNDLYKEIIVKATEEIQAGGNMNVAFAKYPEYIPSIVAQMIKVGEETGEMSVALKSVSHFYSREVDNMTRNMTALIEPVAIVFLAICVAILVFSVILPIYNLVGQMAAGA